MPLVRQLGHRRYWDQNAGFWLYIVVSRLQHRMTFKDFESDSKSSNHGGAVPGFNLRQWSLGEMFGKISSLRIPLPADTRKMVKAGKYVAREVIWSVSGKDTSHSAANRGTYCQSFFNKKPKFSSMKKPLCFVVVTGLVYNLVTQQLFIFSMKWAW